MDRIYPCTVSPNVRRYSFNGKIGDENAVAFVVNKKEQPYGHFEFIDAFQSQRRVMRRVGRVGCNLIMNLGCMTRSLVSEPITEALVSSHYVEVEFKKVYEYTELDKKVIHAVELAVGNRLEVVGDLKSLFAPRVLSVV